MSHAERCPVCKATGTVRLYPDPTKLVCHGCGGDGWVAVPDGNELTGDECDCSNCGQPTDTGSNPQPPKPQWPPQNLRRIWPPDWLVDGMGEGNGNS